MATRVKEPTALSEEFLEETAVIRGTTYRFREISGAKYEEFLKTAEGPEGTANLGTVLRLMIPESMVEPKLTSDQFYSKPLPVVTAIETIVNKMHFRTEPVTAPDAEAEGESSGNGSSPETS